jgi:hypothetical protein
MACNKTITYTICEDCIERGKDQEEIKEKDKESNGGFVEIQLG